MKFYFGFFKLFFTKPLTNDGKCLEREKFASSQEWKDGQREREMNGLKRK